MYAGDKLDSPEVEELRSQVEVLESGLDIVSEEERIERYVKEIQKTETHPVTMTINGQEITANVGGWEADFRTPEQIEAEKNGDLPASPVGIFIGGAGQVENVSQDSRLKGRLVHHAGSRDDGYGRLMEVGISNVPQKVEGMDDEATFRADALLMAKDIYPKIALSDGSLPPLRLYGYSEGAGVAPSLARALRELEIENSKKPNPTGQIERGRHHLTILNLTGIADGDQEPKKAYKAALGFVRTATEVAWLGFKEKFQSIGNEIEENYNQNDEDVDPNQAKLEEAAKKIPTGKEGGKYIMQKFLSSKNDLPALGNQLTKLMRVNPDNKYLNGEWDVIVRAPVADKMFKGDAQLESLLAQKEKGYQMVSPWASLDELITRVVFVGANKVKVNLYGEKGKPNSRHQAADFYPELALPDDAELRREDHEELEKTVI